MWTSDFFLKLRHRFWMRFSPSYRRRHKEAIRALTEVSEILREIPFKTAGKGPHVYRRRNVDNVFREED